VIHPQSTQIKETEKKELQIIEALYKGQNLDQNKPLILKTTTK